MEIEALEKLRVYSEGDMQDDAWNLLPGLVDEAYAEIMDRFMELPLDADGKPVHVGDEMESVHPEEPGAFEAALIGADGRCMDDELSFFYASQCRRYEPRTPHEVAHDMTSALFDACWHRHDGSITQDEFDAECERIVNTHKDTLYEVYSRYFYEMPRKED